MEKIRYTIVLHGNPDNMSYVLQNIISAAKEAENGDAQIESVSAEVEYSDGTRVSAGRVEIPFTSPEEVQKLCNKDT